MARKKQNLSYEEALLELENILSMLENGDLSLDDSLTEFSKGVELYKYCYDLLNKVEGKVKIILDDGNNDIKEVEFNANS
ncbi:exodeoxyribonuclease VII small subunit [Proteiniborus sp. MB09-C3]|uniref:exodeoxyribonuclease VII small subunit n=1 Tax=Proteiniborus sp. MB09-C3 TaxID=3050072 RepID=UPI002555B976|nr:exodeoxyribonuclease VII small subunit [Proteiniborus sp. MB09-C3]WIV10992.1 exodeoxyribonuclease VII small subunit [Proteiniborus sp. MB09-C3]